nr:YceK/YidQ family lipoprotein [uncultured Haemophilus sp.]
MKHKFIIKITRIACFAILIVNLTACGTIINLTQGNYAVYGGVKNDFSAIQDGGVFGVLAVIDLPLSFVFDTLLLPVTLSQ